MAASTVTIDKAYFETMLRRAQFHTDGQDFSTPMNLTIVSIPKVDHDYLLNKAREHDNLLRNLKNGGAADSTINVLTEDATNQETPPDISQDESVDVESEAFATQEPVSQVHTPRAAYRPARHFNRPEAQAGPIHANGHGNGHGNDNVNGNGDGHDSGNINGNGNGIGNDAGGFEHGARKPDLGSRFAQRTLVFSNLVEGTSHQDVANLVAGGQVLDIFMRAARCYSVSFVHSEAASAFEAHTQQNGLWMYGRKVQVEWAERSFQLLGQVAYQILRGATRNLVIRFASPRHTEKSIREDMEHIHNLVIMDITFDKAGHAHVKTAAVPTAIFAKTCMMSRTEYKGYRVEWDIDECCRPLEMASTKLGTASVKSPQPLEWRAKGSSSNNMPLANRFGALAVEGTSYDHDDKDDSEI